MKSSLKKSTFQSGSASDMRQDTVKFYLGAAIGLLYAPIFFLLCGPAIKLCNILINLFELQSYRVRFATVLLACISIQIHVMGIFFLKKIHPLPFNTLNQNHPKLKRWRNRNLDLEIDDVQKDRLLGLCFITASFDKKQLQENINFFSQHCGTIILVKNGKTSFNFKFLSPHNLEIHEIYNRDFQSCFVDIMNQYKGYKIIKFDDDDVYLNGCVEQLLYSQKVSGCECISLKPLFYQFEHKDGSTEIFVSRRFFLPIILSKNLFKISGTLIYFTDRRRTLSYEFPSKYLDQSLNKLFGDSYSVCTTFFIIVRRLFWRQHASVINDQMKTNLIKLN